ncbi:acid phosphatase 1-like [Lotus japonicus]|uniref:acid phosphatase 1-like n=1 Tax=Lotus japonicus TaxID=34305 RepID=UPI00258B8A0B|nr:acid phosphatase 1-like [Lotus japonicus]
MGKALCCCLLITCLMIPLAVADWNILKLQTKDGLKISLKNYCESWRMNVELHNIRDFEVVPEECIEYIGKYVKSTQYRVDSQRATDEGLVYLSTRCNLNKDGRDAWNFDIDDTLLSIVPYYKKNLYGGKKLNVTSLEEWMSKGKAPALDHSLKLFNELKSRGVQIILVTARKEYLRSATIDNLVKVGYYGWARIIFRDPANELVSVKKYKSDVRKQLMNDGYRIWGIVGDQYSSFEGIPSAGRAFKLPNPIYYVA